MPPLTPGSSSAETNKSLTLVFLYSGSVDRATSVAASMGCGPRPPPSAAGVARLGPEIAPSFEPGPFAPHVLPAPAKAGFGAPGAGPRPAPGTFSGASVHRPD